MMDPTEIDDAELLAFATELAGAEQSPWQPGVAVRAFLPTQSISVGPWFLWPLTMQGWLQLDAARSPWLPYAPAAQPTVDDLAAAIGILSGGEAVTAETMMTRLSPEEAAQAGETVQMLIQSAFATCIRMRPPIVSREAASADGFGNWLPILACLIAEQGQSEANALAMRVDRAHAVIAADRRNQAWTVEGVNYQLREI